jgi:hypothetical protein
MQLIVVALIAFGAGVIVGIVGMWRYMERQWQHAPYRFRTIVDGVIALREAKEREAKKV